MSEEIGQIGSAIEDVGKKVLHVLERSAGNPPVLGVELISLGSFVKMIPQIDFVVWDFSGKKVPPPNVQNAVKTAAATGTPIPAWAQTVISTMKAVDEFFGGPGQTFNFNLATGVNPDTAAQQTAVQTIAGPAVPNLLGLLGISLPGQITISEILILGGLLLLFEPLLKAVTGEIGGLLKTAAGAIKLG